MTSKPEENQQTGWLGRLWPFGFQRATTRSYDDDPLIEVTSSTAKTFAKEPVETTSELPRTRTVCLQHIDDNLSGTGQLVPNAEAARMDLIWELNQVRYPLTNLVKTPPPEDIQALRVGVRQGIFQNAIVRPARGAYNQVDGAILVTDRSSGQRFGYHTDYIDEDQCALTNDEKLERRIFFVFLKGEDLPSYHFWQNPDDPDLAQKLYTDLSQLFSLRKLTHQSMHRFGRLAKYLDTDATNEEKAKFAGETFAAISEILCHLRVPMTRELAKRFYAAGTGLTIAQNGNIGESLNREIDRELFLVPGWLRKGQENEEGRVDDGAGDDDEIDEDEWSDASSIFDRRFLRHKHPRARGQFVEDDGVNVYPDGGAENDDLEEAEEESSSDVEVEKDVDEQEIEEALSKPGSRRSSAKSSDIITVAPLRAPEKGSPQSPKKGRPSTPKGGKPQTPKEKRSSRVPKGKKAPQTTNKKGSSPTTKKKAKPKKPSEANQAYNGENDALLTPGEKSPMLPRPPKRKSPDHPDASYQPEKKKRRSVPANPAKESSNDALKRGVTRSGRGFRE